MKTEPLVSLITLNYNQAGVTGDLPESVRHLTYPNIQVIVVDKTVGKANPLKVYYQTRTGFCSCAGT